MLLYWVYKDSKVEASTLLGDHGIYFESLQTLALYLSPYSLQGPKPTG